jgi:hypothetical protein
MTGIVCTSPDLVESLLGSGTEINAEYIPLSEATVALFRGKDGLVLPSPIVQTRSGADGKYTLTINSALARLIRSDPLYLVITKTGYQSIREPIKIGPYSPFHRNVAYLKQSVEK